MSEFSFKQQKNTSIREKVTIDIRNAILSGHIKPGQRIREAEVSMQMGVSRSPVREAIRELEREGLLINEPYRETVVSDVSIREVRNILMPIRYSLEFYVFQYYLDRFDDACINQLQNIVDQMPEQVKEEQIVNLVEQDIKFHQFIINLSNERTILTIWRSILSQTRLHFAKNMHQYIKENNVRKDHQILLDTIKSRNIKAIEVELLDHIQTDKSFLGMQKND